MAIFRWKHLPEPASDRYRCRYYTALRVTSCSPFWPYHATNGVDVKFPNLKKETVKLLLSFPRHISPSLDDEIAPVAGHFHSKLFKLTASVVRKKAKRWAVRKKAREVKRLLFSQTFIGRQWLGIKISLELFMLSIGHKHLHHNQAS